MAPLTGPINVDKAREGIITPARAPSRVLLTYIVIARRCAREGDHATVRLPLFRSLPEGAACQCTLIIPLIMDPLTGLINVNTTLIRPVDKTRPPSGRGARGGPLPHGRGPGGRGSGGDGMMVRTYCGLLRLIAAYCGLLRR